MIGASHGISRMSKAIVSLSFRGDSTVSHIMEINDETGETVEALQFKGVVHGKTYHELHTPGTRIDLYDYRGRSQETEAAVWAWLLTQVGKDYDWLGIWGILRRKMREDPAKWFCSELNFEAHTRCGIRLLNNIFACQVTPATLVTSTRLVYVGFLIVGEDKQDLGRVPVCQIAKKNRMISERLGM